MLPEMPATIDGSDPIVSVEFEGSFPNADLASSGLVSLPLHPGLQLRELDCVCDELAAAPW